MLRSNMCSDFTALFLCLSLNQVHGNAPLLRTAELDLDVKRTYLKLNSTK